MTTTQTIKGGNGKLLTTLHDLTEQEISTLINAIEDQIFSVQRRIQNDPNNTVLQSENSRLNNLLAAMPKNI